MINFNRIRIAFAAILLAGLLSFSVLPAEAQQNTLTFTTLSAAALASDGTVSVTSATGITAAGFGVAGSLLYVVDTGQTIGEPMIALGISGTVITVRRTGGRTAAHASGAQVIIGSQNWFYSVDPKGSCTRSATYVNPYINTVNGQQWSCDSITGTWVRNGDYVQYIPPTQCTFAPTTLTTTNTYIQLGASTVFVLNGLSNAAAGTNTLTCNIMVPTRVTATRGAVLKDITVAIGSQTTAPTSIGTSTLGSITFPTPVATTQTASVVTPVAAGGAVTQLGPTTTVLTVTTAGAFLTFKYTYATAVSMSTDLQLLQFTVPYVQSAAAAMALNTPGIWVHYSIPAL